MDWTQSGATRSLLPLNQTTPARMTRHRTATQSKDEERERIHASNSRFFGQCKKKYDAPDNSNPSCIWHDGELKQDEESLV
ncbi:hypothetical protein CC78DRAFT_532961 [Lojkania enalia]|uniref:Uncharacterized protein n=1 Tax=Lojkania enalia TaxID=147567 RepID=A0A9P4KEW4_9PLEO|nr:hypothetical protein CC78DRAFT_532961 [Didymosphaeria enalia]